MKNFYLFIVILSLFVLSQACSAGRDQDQWRYLHGPAESVTAVIEQGDFIWAGSDQGLIRFDKTTRHLQYWNKTNSGLPQNSVSALAPDNDGGLWIGFRAYGLAHFDGSTWMTVNSTNSDLPDDRIR